MTDESAPPTISDESVDGVGAEVEDAAPVDERVPFALRMAVPEDVPYLVETWKRDATKLPICLAYGDRPAYNITWRARRLLAMHGARVACDVQDQGLILGWACIASPRQGPPPTPPLILWAFVREDFRGQGIAKALLRDLREMDALVGAQIRKAPPLPARWRYSHFANEWALNP